ncbi:MAG: ABC transporter permease, partial [Halieaceae bacterium]
MEGTHPDYQLDEAESGILSLVLSGDWTIHQQCPEFSSFTQALGQRQVKSLRCNAEQLGEWDSALPAFLLQCYNYCLSNNIDIDAEALPEGARRLLAVATAVKTHQRPAEKVPTLSERLDPRARISALTERVESSLEFLGDISLASARLMVGKANSRRVDFLTFIYQAGPDAFGIITLTSFLVGMILAYLGAAQLAQFGAQIYVADLVAVGMLREMGALMT